MTDPKPPIVLIADKLAESTVAALGDQVEVRWVTGTDREALLAALPEADALLVRSATQVDAEALAAGANLKIVARAGVGLDNVDVEAATANGVLVVNAPTSNIHSAAEHAVALLLAAARQIPPANDTTHAGQWKRSSYLGVELYQKTVGVVGFGRIGQLVASRLKAFETEILAYDPYVSAAKAAQLGARLVTLDELLAQADFITVHLPKTPETAGLIDAAALRRTKPGVVIANAARGGLIDEQALADAVSSGHVRSAGLDVFVQEPPGESPLFGLEQVVLTPHLGASTVEAQDRAGTDVAKSVQLALAGEFVPEAVNVSAGPVGEEVLPWLDLARKLGVLLAAVAEQAAVALEIKVYGELAAEPVGVLGLAALRGFLSGLVETPVTFVNAAQVAEGRGLSHVVRTEQESPNHRSLVEVLAVAADGSTSQVAGTLAGRDQVAKITSVGRRGFDLRAEGFNLVISYADRPGALGKVGTLLGDAGVNIQAAAVSHDASGDGATMVLRVDNEIPADLRHAVADSVEATSLVEVDLR
ncbi:D-3-phosphoglycerate dehydrogenase [Segniliparus rotundus DSM 44985]|uniref:D-3-phosphoglycerate dehydrogenase n=1 Tax=Segniliparus rotundus (strain ATCC BAA-972 / CDC 1076 / CIP 108378 / DSM 44985 / JCM 13578) TaxID=640132 RepID=D6Z980_SEGRD|nr:phosphoglycerate dehydrogenase [Segniliparus rotundus]ADG98510.1 D-3-phosphoglycerate dehydrogenase [Segniliparus rotundus DSM 44985]